MSSVPTVPKRPPWRPRKQPPRNAVARIEELAQEGWNFAGIAKNLGVSHVTLRRWCDESPEFEEAITRGRTDLEFKLQNKLLEKALAGDTVAILFYLKSRFGWREGDQSDNSNRINVVFNLPGAMSEAEFQKMKVIEHGSPDDRIEQLPAKSLVRT